MTAIALAVAVALAGLTLACGWTARLDAWCRDQRRASRARLALALAADRAEADAADADAAEDRVRELRRRLHVAEARWIALDPERAREAGVRVMRVA